MADETDLVAPMEIPWTLASTTMPFSAAEADQTSISLFFHQPDDEVLLSQFPEEKLVYLKIAVSVSPASLPSAAGPLPAALLGEGAPCYHMLLDLKVRRKVQPAGAIKPYFHAAAPLNRRMLQTGVVGNEVFEGEAASQFVGRSGSQLHESLNSESRTTATGLGIGVPGLGGSIRTTGTDLTSNRTVSQTVDTTTRQASQERRELVSHWTKVENILTLLNAKYVGTPYLRFSLSPRPLELLSLDASDPNLWFSQLLARRSSGIEGLQEFTAVVVVPRDVDFCVSARLRRVCLLDAPPRRPTFNEPYTGATLQYVRVLNYLDRTFPVGTPIEELDIELVGLPQPPADFRRPIIEAWAVHTNVGGFLGVAPEVVGDSGAPFGPMTPKSVFYKHPFELWLDTLRNEYEEDVARSPLERGVLLGENRLLDTCFAWNGGILAVSSSASSVTPLLPLDLHPDHVAPDRRALSAARTVRARAVETVTRWNAMERQLFTQLANGRTFSAKATSFNDPRVVRVLIDRLAKLEKDDAGNLDFTAAVKALGLSAEHRRMLKSAGAGDLRSIARALQSVPTVERYNDDIARSKKLDRKQKPRREPIAFPISAATRDEIVSRIGEALAGALPASAER